MPDEKKLETGARLPADKVTESALLSLSLRDFFAAFALAGLAVGDGSRAQDVARKAYEHADAMLAQRKGTKK